MKLNRLAQIIIGACLLFLLLAGFQFVPFTPSDKDVEAARQIVARRTSEQILSVEAHDNGTIIISTGWIKGSLSGDGDSFTLRRFFGFWWVWRKEHWAI